jgi:hypothetical protein
MKKLLFFTLLLALLLVGCGTKKTLPPVETILTEAEPQTSTVLETSPTPDMLLGMWRSLDPGELDMVETIEFSQDGNISVNCVYQGKDAGTIYGTYYVMGEFLHCDMFANGAPYIIDYRFELDGRELVLYDNDGAAHYIKVS